jgi:hypothetical protein
VPRIYHNDKFGRVSEFTHISKFKGGTHAAWLYVSSQLSLLDGYLIIQKYNEPNHRDRGQININSDKKI